MAGVAVVNRMKGMASTPNPYVRSTAYATSASFNSSRHE
jgi:hypothetical protein